MNLKYEIDETWIKASILGTIWAASEIVLGSFLHNLKIPFSGNILTAIAIIILVSTSYIWKEKGLFWRAGLICALMKTISPSAVIFGPMIAIFSESLLIELSVRLFGHTFIGFALGAMLAMSWNLFQKIANFLIFYGFNIVELYASLMKMAQKQLNIQSEILWLPIIALLVLFCLFGLISAFAGMKIGHKLRKQTAVPGQYQDNTPKISSKNKRKTEFNYSILWLLADVLLLIAAFSLQNFTKLLYSSLFIAGLVAVWATRYQRAMSQLSRPRFWVFFAGITMATAFAFSKVQGQSLLEGFAIGLQMNFRAVLIITGFSVLGTELYNPKIRAFFLKTSFNQLPLALELSFESLPMTIAHIPDFKTVVKNPISVMYQVVAQAEKHLSEIKERLKNIPRVYVVFGAVAEGKTAFLDALTKELISQNINVEGFLSLRHIENNETTGYNIRNIRTNEQLRFLRLKQDMGNGQSIGRFSISDEGLQAGHQILEQALVNQPDVIVIDEVGKLELKGGGWADSLQKLLGATQSTLVLSVRKGSEHEVLAKWQILGYEIIPVSSRKVTDVAAQIIAEIQK